MGGTVIYDSIAKLTGCEKIETYFAEKGIETIDHHVLFSKEETKEIVKELFAEKARERDF